MRGNQEFTSTIVKMQLKLPNPDCDESAFTALPIGKALMDYPGRYVEIIEAKSYDPNTDVAEFLFEEWPGRIYILAVKGQPIAVHTLPGHFALTDN